MKTLTTVPVPEVFAWSSDSSNPVGAEYIIMEKAAGIQLFKKWADMDETCRLALIERLTKLESQMASIHFPAFGSLYLRQSITDEAKRMLLDTSLDPSSSFVLDHRAIGHGYLSQVWRIQEISLTEDPVSTCSRVPVVSWWG